MLVYQRVIGSQPNPQKKVDDSHFLCVNWSFDLCIYQPNLPPGHGVIRSGTVPLHPCICDYQVEMFHFTLW